MTTKFTLPLVAGLGAIGGSAAGFSYWYALPTNLKEELIREGTNLLDLDSNKDDEQWTLLADKYSENNSNEVEVIGGKQIKKINGLKIDKPADDQKAKFDALKTQCKKLFQMPIKEDETFKTAKIDAKNWCSANSELILKKQ